MNLTLVDALRTIKTSETGRDAMFAPPREMPPGVLGQASLESMMHRRLAHGHMRNIFEETEGLLRTFQGQDPRLLTGLPEKMRHAVSPVHSYGGAISPIRPHLSLTPTSVGTGESTPNHARSIQDRARVTHVTAATRNIHPKSVSLNGQISYQDSKSITKGSTELQVTSPLHLHDPPHVQRLHTPVDVSERRGHAQIPKLRFKSAAFSGNTGSPTENGAHVTPPCTDKTTQRSPASKDNRPLDLSQPEVSHVKTSSVEPKVPLSGSSRKRPHSDTCEVAPLDLSLKKPRAPQASDDDVVFMGVHKPITSPQGNNIHAKTEHQTPRDWRKEMHLKLAKRRMQANRSPMGMYGQIPAGMSGPTPVSSAHRTGRPLAAERTVSPHTRSPTRGIALTPRSTMPPHSVEFQAPRSVPHSMHAGVRPDAASYSRLHAAMMYRARVPGLGFQAVPAVGLLDESTGLRTPPIHGRSPASDSRTPPMSQFAARMAIGSHDTAYQPRLFLAPSPATLQQTNGIQNHYMKAKATVDDKPEVSSARQNGIATVARPGPGRPAMSPVGKYHTAASRSASPSPRSHASPSHPQVSNEAKTSPLHIDIPPGNNYSVALEQMLRTPSTTAPHTRPLPRPMNSRSIMTGTAGHPQIRRRLSERSPPHLSLATTLPQQAPQQNNIVTCPSPLPSPQMPILSPQSAQPPGGSLFPQSGMKQSSRHRIDLNGDRTAIRPAHRPSTTDQRQHARDLAGGRHERPITLDTARDPKSGVPIVNGNDCKPPQTVPRDRREVYSGDRGATTGVPAGEATHENSGRKKVVSPTPHAAQLVSMVASQGAAVASMIAQAAQVNNGSKTCPSQPSHSESGQDKRLGCVPPLMSVLPHVFPAPPPRPASTKSTPEVRPAPDNLSAFVPTSERYGASSTFTISSAAAVSTPAESVAVMSTDATSPHGRDERPVTKTVSVTSTTCSTRVVPVANVNPMIQGKLATTQPPVSMGHMPGVPASGYLPDWKLELASFKRNTLRVPPKLIYVPEKSPQRPVTAVTQGSSIPQCSIGQAVSTTTVTTRPTPVSLPSRTATESPRSRRNSVTTHPVTPIKILLKGETVDESAVRINSEQTDNIESGQVTETSQNVTANQTVPKRRRRRMLRDNEDRQPIDTREFSIKFVKTFGKRPNSVLLEHMLRSNLSNPNSLTGNKMDHESNHDNQGESVLQSAKTPMGQNNKLKNDTTDETHEALAAGVDTESSEAAQSKATGDNGQPAVKHSGPSGKRPGPMMKKIARQMAREMAKHGLMKRTKGLDKEKANELKQGSAVDTNTDRKRSPNKGADSLRKFKRRSPILMARSFMAEYRAAHGPSSPKGRIKFSKNGLSRSPRREIDLRCNETLLDELFDGQSENYDSGDLPDYDGVEDGEALKRRQRTARQKRSILDQLANSDGYVADKRRSTACADLFADPSKLGREERALQRAMQRFSEMEKQKEKKRQRQFRGRRQTAAMARAIKLKRRAVKTTNSPIKDSERRLFGDFQPMIMHTRTRSQEAGKNIARHGWRLSLTYHKDDAYEEALRRDEDRRKRIREKYRARQRAQRTHLRFTRGPSTAFKKEGTPPSTSAESSNATTPVTTPEGPSETPVETQPLIPSTPPPENAETPVILGEESNVSPTSSWANSPPTKFRRKRRFHRRNRDGFPKPKRKKMQWKRPGYHRGRGRRGYGGMREFSGQRQLFGDGSLYPQDYCGAMPGEDGFPIHPDHIKLEPTDDGFRSPMTYARTHQLSGYHAVPPMLKKLNVYRDTGETVLHRSARLGYEDVALYCAENKYVDVNARDNAGFTPLHECCVSGHVTIAKYLLAHGADVNVSSKVDGIRPIHDAIENDNIEMVRLLLSCGADPHLATYSGRTALKLARTDNMRRFLRDHFADLKGEESDDLRWDLTDLNPPKGKAGVLGFDLFQDVPSDPEDEADVTFDLSSAPLPPVYRLCLREGEGCENYVLWADVKETVHSTKDDFMARHGDVTFASVTWQSLVDQTERCQIRSSCIPSSACPDERLTESVHLVLYDKHFKRAVGIDFETLHTESKTDLTLSEESAKPSSAHEQTSDAQDLLTSSKENQKAESMSVKQINAANRVPTHNLTLCDLQDKEEKVELNYVVPERYSNTSSCATAAESKPTTEIHGNPPGEGRAKDYSIQSSTSGRAGHAPNQTDTLLQKYPLPQNTAEKAVTSAVSRHNPASSPIPEMVLPTPNLATGRGRTPPCSVHTVRPFQFKVGMTLEECLAIKAKETAAATHVTKDAQTEEGGLPNSGSDQK